MQSRSLLTAASLLLIVGLIASPATALAEAGAEDTEALPMQELELLTEVYSRIKRDYVDEVDDADLFRAAIRGMLSELDDHSGYLDAEAFEELQEGTRGEYGGVGLELSRDGDRIRVIAPIDDTPASRAGIEAGDLIVEVDGEAVRDQSLNQVIQRLRGEPGSSVTVTILRDERDEPETLELERDTVQVDSVRSRTLEPGYGYVRISRFQERTARDLGTALDELVADADGALHGIILDLRNNPGGVLSSAVAVADTFLGDGLIVYTEGRVAEAASEHHANPVDRIHGAPLVVLINRGSASGSEIVAGALQDHGRAVVLGEASFGKGSVQSVLPLDGAAIQLTTARYYTPQGRSIQDEGIQPDIPVKELELTERATPPAHPDQPGHREAPSEAEEEAADLAREDYVLFEALNLLRGLRIFEER